KSRTLRDQLGERMIEQSGANFDAPLSEHLAAPKQEEKAKPAAKPVQREWISSSEKTERARARLDTKPGRPTRDGKEAGRGPDRDRSERKPFGDKPDRFLGDKPDRPRGDKPEWSRGEKPSGGCNEEPGGKPAKRSFVQRSR